MKETQNRVPRKGQPTNIPPKLKFRRKKREICREKIGIIKRTP
jgi:hypothetical protein